MKVAWFDHQDWENPEKEYIDTFKSSLRPDNCQGVEADIISVFASSNVNSEVLETVRPEAVVTRSTGYDHIDVEKAEELGIRVYNVPHYGSNTVAEHAMALLLGVARHLPKAEEKTHHEFHHEGLEGFELKGKKLGVIGTGNIGQKMIQMVNGFEMDIIAYDKYEKKELEQELDFMYVTFEDLLKKSDIISIHCPLTKENQHLLSEEEFEKMDDTVIINTARGGLIDSKMLLKALKNGSVKAAGLDVMEMEEELKERNNLERKTDFRSEKFKANIEIINRKDVIVTPHMAFNTTEAKNRIQETTIKNIEERPEENRVV